MRFDHVGFCTTPACICALVLSGCGGNVLTTSSNTPAPIGPAPTVIAVGEQVNGVAPNRKQEVQFSEAMDPSTINAQSFHVTDSSGKLAQGTVSYDPNFETASFLPTPALQVNATYTSTITIAAASTGGMHLASPYTYTFDTRSDADTSPLAVNSVLPAANTACVSPTTPITITFNEAPDANSVNTTNIVVTGPGGAVIPVTVKLNITTTQVVLTPASPLPPGTITVSLKNVADLAGVMLAAPYTWSFSTGCSGGSATYLYVGVEFPQPAIRGYQVNVDTASLTDVPGSPFAHSGASGPGAVIVNKDFVYATSTDETTVGGAPFPSGTISLWVYHADATSGTLTQVQRFTLPIGGGLYLEPTGHDMYVFSGTEIVALAINPDGTVTNTGSGITLPGPVGSVAVSPDGRLMYATVTTGTVSGCGKGPCPSNDVIWQIDRDTVTGSLTLNHSVSGTENLHLGKLQFDASGGYLLGQSSSTHINVESVNHSTGDLTPVPGSPFTSTAAPTGEFTRAFQIDPSGKFVYVVNLGETNFNSKYISVFSLSQATGALTPMQTFDMTPGTDVTGFDVDQSLVMVVNWPSGGSDVNFVPASINVFKRDPVTGFVSAGGSPVIMQDQERLENAAVMHYQ